MPVKVWLQSQPDIAVIGSIREISPEANSTTGTYEVKVALPSPPPEMRLGAIVVGRAEAKGQKVMSLPSLALLQSGEGPQVWVVGEDGKVHRRGIELLKFNEDSVVISRGLSPGEKVVTAGVNSLAEGEVVKPERRSTDDTLQSLPMGRQQQVDCRVPDAALCRRRPRRL